MYTIAKRWTFDAAHHLTGLPDGHKCARFHGHTYTVEMILQSHKLQPEGWVRDYGEIGSRVKRSIDKYFDHHDLNSMLDQPTAELLARWFFDTWRSHIPELIAVKVSESPDTWACYSPNSGIW